MELVGKIFIAGRFFVWSSKFAKTVTAQSIILLLLSYLNSILTFFFWLLSLLVVSFIAALGFLLYGGRYMF